MAMSKKSKIGYTQGNSKKDSTDQPKGTINVDEESLGLFLDRIIRKQGWIIGILIGLGAAFLSSCFWVQLFCRVVFG